MGVISDGNSYGVPEDLLYSFPVVIKVTRLYLSLSISCKDLVELSDKLVSSSALVCSFWDVGVLAVFHIWDHYSPFCGSCTDTRVESDLTSWWWLYSLSENKINFHLMCFLRL